MLASPIFLEAEQASIEQLANRAAQNVEAFRAEALEAYVVYGRQDRIALAALESRSVTAYDVLDAWETKLLPSRRLLSRERSGASFRKLYAKHMLVTEDEAKHAIDGLIDARLGELLEQTLLDVYPLPSGKGKDVYNIRRVMARGLLSRPDELLERLKKCYTNYMIYREVASRLRVTVVDPYVAGAARIKSTVKLRSERKKTAKNEGKRLREIDARLSKLNIQHGGLLGQIASKGWDMVAMMSLRQQYERRIRDLPDDRIDDFTARLEIFHEVTHDFRDDYIGRLVPPVVHDSLGTARAATEAIDVLLLQFFDLDATHRNQMILQMREHRELTQERQAILSLQKQRATLVK